MISPGKPEHRTRSLRLGTVFVFCGLSILAKLHSYFIYLSFMSSLLPKNMCVYDPDSRTLGAVRETLRTAEMRCEVSAIESQPNSVPTAGVN